MRNYDESEPLIAIHIPKTGGVSVKEVFKLWFGNSLYFNYYNEVRGILPTKLNFNELSEKSPICIFGHFNSKRGFGIKDYYPEAKQFVTIMRDPFELALSTFYYLHKVSGNWKDANLRPAKELDRFLETYEPNVFNHFPFEVTLANYRCMIEENFICIGITETMDISMQVIAKQLDFPAPTQLEVLNQTVRPEICPDGWRERFIERWPLEYAVYEHAKTILEKQRAQLGSTMPQASMMHT